MIGQMDIPANFYYLDVFAKGKPRHEKYDDFHIRHPQMGTEKRAKIFSPFDALKGFDEAISAKEELYEPKRDLGDMEKDELDRRIRILKNLIRNGKAARESRIEAVVTYFIPCEDINNDAYGIRGNYRTATGIVTRIDTEVGKCLYIDDRPIRFRDIIGIESKGIFDRTEYDDNW